jgi:hypothetical protein
VSTLRPEVVSSKKPATSDYTVWYLLRAAVAKRRKLIKGRLGDECGKHCAMGCLWADNPSCVVNCAITDEVAMVNDSGPTGESEYSRWRRVNAWIKERLARL